MAEASSAANRVEALSAALDTRTGVGRFGSQIIQPLRAIASADRGAGGRSARRHWRRPAKTKPPGPDGDGREPRPRAGVPRRTHIASRADAYDAILRIADFFAEAEPQSLVARSLREVVRRGRPAAGRTCWAN